MALVAILVLSIMVNPVFAAKREDCDFPAIFNFGDSNSDTGGLASTFLPVTPPYGTTFFGRPAGRLSDGRLIIDFMAQNLGLSFLSPYLDSLGTNYSHGANFATAGSTIRPPSSVLPQGLYSPVYLDVQCIQFRIFKPKTQFIRSQGGIFARLMPKPEYFADALYTFDIGQNDFFDIIFRSSIEQVNASVPDMINTFSKNVTDIYNLGARSFWIHNTGPVGCLPVILANFPSAEKDAYGCAKQYNEVAKYFNQKLKEAVVQLRRDLPLAAITYVDIYSVKYSLFSNPRKYGFRDPLVACCGSGGRYNYNNNATCGETVNVNGSNVLVGSCSRPSVKVIWDGIFYTDAANKVIFDEISTGAFSDPPLPLNKACRKS